MKKGVKAIKGKSEITVGVWENWNVSKWHENTPIEMRNEDYVKWELYHLKNGITPVKVLEKDLGNFRFQQKAVGEKFLISAHVYEPDLHSASSMEISVVPNEKPEILGIDITDVNNKPITNKLAYGQNINIHVRTVGMIGHHLNITLWEDDTDGAGHSDKNTKIVKFDKPARVGSKGIAHAQFQLSPNFAKLAKTIGDKKDSNHEYYVTAFGMGLLKASRNVNLIYPKERLTQTEDHLKGKKKETETIPPFKKKVPIQNKSPEQKGNSKESNTKKGISQVYFVDSNNRPISGTFKQTQLKAVIISNGLKGKDVKITVFEEDEISNDTLFVKTVTISGDKTFVIVDLCDIPKSKGEDTAKIGGFVLYEDNIQELLVDVEVLETHTHLKSKTINVDSKAFKNDTPTGVSKLVIEDAKAEKKDKNCECQQLELIWGAKVSCKFRKKVVEIAKRLGKDPNLLMAAMALETGSTFSPIAGKGSSYVGLIQFGDDAAESVGTTKEALLKMTALEQLDYVEKYLTKKKDKLVTLTDFYLSILMPVDVGKGSTPDHIVFDNEYPLEYKKDGKTLTDLSKSRHYGYRQNPAFFYEDGERKKVKKAGGKKYKGEGKTYIWEIEKHVEKYLKNGKAHKANVFLCDKDIIPKPDTELGTWNVTITEKYTGKKCNHEKARDNCRRGSIEVFDHNKKSVLTISDCLLEGWKGEDRQLTDNDTPFGAYQINSTPFIMGSSTGENRMKYGSNPRLAFEPIKGSGDEIDKSGRSLIRIHGGRQEENITFLPLPSPKLLRSSGCIRVFDADAKLLYDWWVEFHKANPNIKPGKVKILK
ncbi:L,D-transpeptidase [Flavobacterium sp.]|uniref:L,D-transpeptidase n=1 Tax=Flavobacterium sp. TaxID=239 RepID=UPI0037517C83